MDLVLGIDWEEKVTLEPNTKVGTISTVNKVPPTLIPEVIEGEHTCLMKMTKNTM